VSLVASQGPIIPGFSFGVSSRCAPSSGRKLHFSCLQRLSCVLSHTPFHSPLLAEYRTVLLLPAMFFRGAFMNKMLVNICWATCNMMEREIFFFLTLFPPLPPPRGVVFPDPGRFFALLTKAAIPPYPATPFFLPSLLNFFLFSGSNAICFAWGRLSLLLSRRRLSPPPPPLLPGRFFDFPLFFCFPATAWSLQLAGVSIFFSVGFLFRR